MICDTCDCTWRCMTAHEAMTTTPPSSFGTVRKPFVPDLASDYPIKPLKGSPLEEEYLADIANDPDPVDPSGERRARAIRRLMEIDEERRR